VRSLLMVSMVAIRSWESGRQGFHLDDCALVGVVTKAKN
ncbi:unnamed protein product, partial [Acidithrix sp. C25]